jgi:lysophospholipase L1-like esterase
MKPLRLALVALALLTAASCSGGGPAVAPTVYAALGASSTAGWGASSPSSGYVALLAKEIAAARGGVELHNFGLPGARVSWLLSHELPAAIAVAPDVVTVWDATNDLVAGDAPEAYGAQLESLLRQLRAGTAAKVFVGDLLDLTKAPRFRAHPEAAVTPARIAAFNANIRAAAAATGAFPVPLDDVPLDDAFFSADGLHPSDTGHARIADAFWRQMAPQL